MGLDFLVKLDLLLVPLFVEDLPLDSPEFLRLLGDLLVLPGLFFPPF